MAIGMAMGSQCKVVQTPRTPPAQPLLKFGKKRPGGSPSASATTTTKYSDDGELAIIVPDELNKMDLTANGIFELQRHFSRDYKAPQKDKKVNFVKGNFY